MTQGITNATNAAWCHLANRGELRRNHYILSTPILLLIYPPDGSAPLLLIFRITHNRETGAHDVSEEGLGGINNLGLSPDIRR